MSYSKFKDDSPQNTIKKINEILNKLNISYSLDTTKRISGIYSSSFRDKLCGWVTCGKGTTAEYCEASALGEAMEHLCNGFAYDYSSLSSYAVEACNFLKFPDEIILPVEKIKEISPLVYEDFKYIYSLPNGQIPSDETLFNLIKKALGKETLIYVPYYSVKQKKEIYLPEEIVDQLCGSNGGGAGNSAYEALGHGLDEIIERYAKYQIYSKRLTPPTIPFEYISTKSPALYETIKSIENNFGYKVIVKDASLNNKFPVIAVTLIDPKNKSYMANFGCHPIFDIALERCLTEMFQFYEFGNNIIKRKNMTKWYTVEDHIIDSRKNWVSLLKDDVGFLPDSFFASDSSWQFIEWKEFDDYTNEIGFRYQLENLYNQADDIFIRNNSFLGFDVYRIYVPKYSINNVPFNDKDLHSLSLCKDFIKKANEFTKLNPSEIEEYSESLFNPNTYVSSIIFHNMEEYMSYALHAALLYERGLISQAMNILRIQDNPLCQAALKVIELQEKNTPLHRIKDLIDLFLNSEEKAFALCWCEQQVFLNLYKQFVSNQYVVSNVGYGNHKTLPLNQLHISLKNQMKNVEINQKDIVLLVGNVL